MLLGEDNFPREYWILYVFQGKLTKLNGKRGPEAVFWKMLNRFFWKIEERKLLMEIKIAGTVKESIVDGPGIRYAVFVQGCPHGCPGCHNPQTHPFEGGSTATVEEVFADFQRNPILKGITLSGGEPFCQAAALAQLAALVHSAGKDVVVFTGYIYEDLLRMDNPAVHALLDETDLLIDGPYLEAQRDLELRFRGSANQRLIDMPRTRQEGRVALRQL